MHMKIREDSTEKEKYSELMKKVGSILERQQ